MAMQIKYTIVTDDGVLTFRRDKEADEVLIEFGGKKILVDREELYEAVDKVTE